MKQLTLGLLIASIFGSAQADFTILDPAQRPVAPAPVQAPTPVPAQVAPVQAVSQPAPAQKLATAAPRNMSSLKDTILKVLPAPAKKWKVYTDKSLNSSVPVEYTPSTDWKQSLSILATRYNLIFSIDENKKTLKIDQGPGGMRDTSLDNQKLAQRVLVPEQDAPALAPNGQLQIVVKDNQRLSDAISTFLKAGNWRMEWKAGSDIEVKVGFTETDKDLAVLLKKVLSPYRMHAVLHPKNNIAVVESDANI